MKSLILGLVAGILLAAACSFPGLCIAQGSHSGLDDRLSLPDERLIFSFRTPEGKTLSICTSENPNYLVYRFGTKENVELEYPENKDSAWEKFAYCEYFRGGGTRNAAMTLKSLFFINGDYTYEIRDNYWSVEDRAGLT